MKAADAVLAEQVGERLGRSPISAERISSPPWSIWPPESGEAGQAQVTPQERRLTLAALMAVLLLSTLDQTVVGTAMPESWPTPWPGADFLGHDSYMPGLDRARPDLWQAEQSCYGRKPILIFGVTTFLFGSMLCGMSGEFGDLPVLGGGMTQLIVFRAIQGFGGAALFTSTFTIIADLYSPRERGKIMGVFASVIGFSLVMGPLVGGF